MKQLPEQFVRHENTYRDLRYYILIIFYRVSISDLQRFDALRVLRLIVISICHEF